MRQSSAIFRTDRRTNERTNERVQIYGPSQILWVGPKSGRFALQRVASLWVSGLKGFTVVPIATIIGSNHFLVF